MGGKTATDVCEDWRVLVRDDDVYERGELAVISY